MLIFLLLTVASYAGEMHLKDAPATTFRRLFAVCEVKDGPGCTGFACELKLMDLACERVPGGDRGSCTFRCNGNEHMLSGEQALDIFKVVENQKALIKKTESTETFKGVKVSCDPSKTDVTGVCKVKHANIKSKS